MKSFPYSQRYQLPRGYEIEFTLDGSSFGCAWSPRVPTGKMAKKLTPAYREARNSFLASLGVPTMVIEL